MKGRFIYTSLNELKIYKERHHLVPIGEIEDITDDGIDEELLYQEAIDDITEIFRKFPWVWTLPTFKHMIIINEMEKLTEETK